jgi:hypothetical protein
MFFKWEETVLAATPIKVARTPPNAKITTSLANDTTYTTSWIALFAISVRLLQVTLCLVLTYGSKPSIFSPYRQPTEII